MATNSEIVGTPEMSEQAKIIYTMFGNIGVGLLLAGAIGLFLDGKSVPVSASFVFGGIYIIIGTVISMFKGVSK